MWILLFLCLVIAFGLPHWGVFMEMRFYIGGMPINLLDALVPGAALCGLMVARSSPSYIATRPHPLLGVLLAAFALDIVVGVVVGMAGGADRWFLVENLRDTAMLPLSLLAGYYLIANFKGANWLIYGMVLLGLYCSVMLLTHFASSAATISTLDANLLSTMEYGVAPGDMATALLAFCLMVGIVRLAPVWLELIVAAVTFIGAVSSMHRSEWIAAMVAILAGALAIPRGLKLRGFIRLATTAALLAVASVIALGIINRFATRDLLGMLVDRLGSVLPGYVSTTSTVHAAWDTRTSGLWANIELWLSSPLFGRGFGIQEAMTGHYGADTSWGHTPWLDVSAMTGVIGFTTYSIVVWGVMIVGRRMALAARDRTTMLVAVLGLAAGAWNFVYGWMSGCFNSAYGAMFLGIIVGVVLRCRAMQLELQRQQAPWPAVPMAAPLARAAV